MVGEAACGGGRRRWWGWEEVMHTRGMRCNKGTGVVRGAEGRGDWQVKGGWRGEEEGGVDEVIPMLISYVVLAEYH